MSEEKSHGGYRSLLSFQTTGLIGLIAFIVFMGQPKLVHARVPRLSQPVKVSASVGEFYLSLSGWMSPYASIILTSDGVFMRATVADKSGNWSIEDVLIRRGFSHFCLTAVDFYKLGQSETCLTIPPAQNSVTLTEIFLPPTLALSRNEVPAGGKVLAFGYTMPGAKVFLKLSNGKTLETYADGNGYYVFSLEGLPAGKYQLYATAHYNQKDSLKPSKTLLLTSLSWWDQLLSWIRWLFGKIVEFFTSLGLGPLLLGIPLLILITILILKLWPEKFTFIYENKLIGLLPKPAKRLHHWWFVGY